MRRTHFAAALLLCACRMVTEGTGDEESSEGETSSSDDGSDDSITTTMANEETGFEGESSSAVSESEGGSESSDGEGESSTGEPITDFALHFDGTSSAHKIGDTGGDYGWTATDFTAEAWVQITDDSATGIIIDAQNGCGDGCGIGWALYIHPDSHLVTFSFRDEYHVNQVVTGPNVADLGTGWHHIAATKSGPTSYLHIDGIVVSTETVSSDPYYGVVVLSVGAASTDEAYWALRDVSVDEIRVSEGPLYTSNFDPPIVLEAIGGDLFTFRFDEGVGVVATDESGMQMGIESPMWVEGYDP